MNNPKLNVPAIGRRASDRDRGTTDVPTGEAIAERIFQLIGEASSDGKTLTVWDLRKVLDLSLSEVFVGLRALEFERLACRGTPAMDPLSAPVTLTEKGREVYFG